MKIKKCFAIFVVLTVVVPIATVGQEGESNSEPTIGGILKDVVKIALPEVGTIISELFPGNRNRVEKDEAEKKLENQANQLKESMAQQLKGINVVVDQLRTLGRIAEPASEASLFLARIERSLAQSNMKPDEALWADINDYFEVVESRAAELTSISSKGLDLFINDTYLYSSLKGLSAVGGPVLANAKRRMNAKDGQRMNDYIGDIQDRLNRVSPALGLYIVRMQSDLEKTLKELEVEEQSALALAADPDETEIRIGSFEKILATSGISLDDTA